MSAVATPDAERGTTLVEALVALLVLGLAVGGAHALHRAALRAEVRAAATAAALVAASSAVERSLAGLPAEAVPVGGPGPVLADAEVLGTTGSGWLLRRCGDGGRPERIRVTGTVLGAASPSGAGTGPVSVPLDAVAGSVTQDGGRLDVRLLGLHADAPLPPLVVRDDGGERPLIPDGAGCSAVLDATGPVRLVAGEGSVLPEPGGIVLPATSAAPVETRVLLLGELTLVVASASGEPPDRTVGGAITWWPADDHGGATAAPGAALTVTAGLRTVIVGTCADPRAGGAVLGVLVGPGTTTSAEVLLPGIDVAAGAASPGRVLVVQRDRPCPGTGLRPRLEWDLTGVARAVAVPDGRWRVHLQNSGGSVVAGPVTVGLAGAARMSVPW